MCCKLLINLGISMRVCLACDHHSHMCSQWEKKKKINDKNWWSNKDPIFTTPHKKPAKKQSQWLRNSLALSSFLVMFSLTFSSSYNVIFIPFTNSISFQIPHPPLNTFYFKCSSSIPLYFPFHCHAFSASCPTSFSSSLLGMEMAKSIGCGWESWEGRREWNETD